MGHEDAGSPESVYLQLAQMRRERDEARALLRTWEPRVICPQCGQRYSERVCGFAHAAIQAALEGHDG